MGRTTLSVAVLLLVVSGCRNDGRQPAARNSALDRIAAAPTWYPPAAAQGYTEIGPIATPVPLARAENSGPWPLALDQAIAIALQHSDVVRVLDGGDVVNGAATSYDPAIVAQSTRVALAAFDTSFGANVFWNHINQPPDAFFEPGVLNPGRYDEGGYTAGFTKSWLSGAQTRISYNPPTGYLFFPNGTEGFNPTHTSNIELAVSQPLLRGGGVEFNGAPIVITQIKTSQSAWDFKQSTMEFVRSVEQAYWQLNAAQIALSGIEEQLPLIEEVVRIEQASLEAKRAIPADVAKSRAQLHAFRKRRLEMQSLITEREIQLRHLLGVEPCEGGKIVPTTAPSHAPLVINPQATLAMAIDRRPDLLRQRLGIRIRELELTIARNSLLPQLDAQALYRMNGVGDKLGDALSMMSSAQYGDWQIGATFSVPLGRNAGKAKVRAAELQLDREHALLRQNVQGVAYELANIVQRVQVLRQQCEEADNQVRQCQEWLRGARVRYKIPMPGGETSNWLLQALDDYLLAMRSSADATADAGDLLARYNTELVRLQEATGVLLENTGICLSEDPTRKIRVSLAAGSLPIVEMPATTGLPQQAPGSDVPAPMIPGQPGPPAMPRPNPPVETLPLPADPTPIMNSPQAWPRPGTTRGLPAGTTTQAPVYQSMPAPPQPVAAPLQQRPVWSGYASGFRPSQEATRGLPAGAMARAPVYQGVAAPPQPVAPPLQQQPMAPGYGGGLPPMDSIQRPTWSGPAVPQQGIAAPPQPVAPPSQQQPLPPGYGGGLPPMDSIQRPTCPRRRFRSRALQRGSSRRRIFPCPHDSDSTTRTRCVGIVCCGWSECLRANFHRNRFEHSPSCRAAGWNPYLPGGNRR